MHRTGIAAVTGSSGGIGGRVAARLAARGLAQRLIVRDAHRAPQLADAEVAEAAYGRTDAARAALRGVDTLFMVSAAEHRDRVAQHLGFVAAAADAGVQHVIYLSIVGAAEQATFTLARDHWRTEEELRSSGLAYTFLRDNLYADFVPFLVAESGDIRGPAGSGRVALVARDDVAEVAAAVLADPARFRGVTLDLTGPSALDLHEVAEVLGRHLGRPVRYVAESVAEAYASRRHYGAPDWQLDAWVSTYAAIAAGEFAATSTAVRDVTGHAPLSLERVLAAR